MLASVAVWVIAASGGSDVEVMYSDRLGTASGLGVQTEASAQLGEEDSLWARVL